MGLASWADYVMPLEGTEFYSLLADKSMVFGINGSAVAVPYAVEGYGIIYNDAIMRTYFSLPDKVVSINSAEEIHSFAMLKVVVEDMSRHRAELGTGCVCVYFYVCRQSVEMADPYRQCSCVL